MKKLNPSLALIVFIITQLNYSSAQNPKTNAGKVNNKSPQGYQAPAIPNPPAQRPVQNDSVNKSNSAPVNQQQTSSLNPISKTNSDGNHLLLSAGFMIGIPQNQFSDVSNKNLGGGLGISVMYNFMGTDDKEKSPVNIYLGGTFEYLYFGGSTSNFSYDDPSPFNNTFTNKVTSTVNINAYTFLLASRVEFLNGPIIPFVEVATGGRYFDGIQKGSVSHEQKPGTQLPTGTTFTPSSKSFSQGLESDIVGTYGYGGGLRLGTNSFRVELKLMYMKGTNGRYIDKSTIKYDANNNLTYETKTSTTDMLLPQISFSTNF
jgi:hypothetical protein